MHVIMRHSKLFCAEGFNIRRAQRGEVVEVSKAVGVELIKDGTAMQCYPDGSRLQFEPYADAALDVMRGKLDGWTIDSEGRSCRLIPFEEIKSPNYFPEFQQEEISQ